MQSFSLEKVELLSVEKENLDVFCEKKFFCWISLTFFFMKFLLALKSKSFVIGLLFFKISAEKNA